MRNDTPSGRDWDVLVHQKREGNAGDGPPRKKQRTHHTVYPFAKSAKGDWLKGGRGNVETFTEQNEKKRHAEYRLENQRQEAHKLNSRQRKKQKTNTRTTALENITYTPPERRKIFNRR
jgi:hypothetical protein